MRQARCPLSMLIPLLLVFAAGCAHEDGSAAASNVPAAGGDQVAVGQHLYGEKCAKCHGSGGEGISGKAPAVVGASALPLDPPAAAKRRDVQFHTAADVFSWVKVNMPGNARGSLTDEQYAAIIAFDLKANGVDLKGKTIDATSAAAIVLHP